MRFRGIAVALVVLLVISLLVPLAETSLAQDGADAWTDYKLNLRTGPGTEFDILAVLAPGTGLSLEARNTDASWLLVRTLEGADRGWLAAVYLSYRDGVLTMNLPESAEVMPFTPAISSAPETGPGENNADSPVADQAPAESAPPAGGASAESLPGVGVDPASLSSVAGLPVVASTGARSAAILQKGLQNGMNPRVFTLVGECNTLAPGYMVPIGTGDYNLGTYAHLQATIDYFRTERAGSSANSFVRKGVTVNAGFTSMSVSDPSWAPPGVCQDGESPLACEYRETRPGVAIVMFGLLDVYWLSPGQYEAAMRDIVEYSIEQGVIPVLTTFPIAQTNTTDIYQGAKDFEARAAARVAFNEVVARLANEYGVPLMNLWGAATALPLCGFAEGDYIHMPAGDPAQWGDFSTGLNQNVFAIWNLATLQMLDALRVSVLGG